MERKIGEIFERYGEWYQCVKSDGTCNGCAGKFRSYSFCYGFKECVGKIFKKLEKVGESYSKYVFPRGNVLVQRYKLHIPCDTNVSNGYWIYHWNEKLVDIEIKQTKEYMEEKKPTYDELLHYYNSTVGLWAIDRSPQEVSLNWICDNAFQLGIDEKDSNSENIGKNLREFDLEAAKAGKPVVTMAGRKARIICFDRNDLYPIVALIECEDGKEIIGAYSKEGQTEIHEIKGTNLMMLSEKKEGWVNIDKGGSVKITISSPYSTKEEAIHDDNECTIDTIKINWSE